MDHDGTGSFESSAKKRSHCLDDVALVSRARNGDPEATQALLERHQDAAYTAALRLLGEPADAEDVMQDALVRAYSRIDDLGDGASFAAWVRKIAINLSLNVIRRRGTIRFEPLEGTGRASDDGHEPARDFSDDAAPSPEDAAMTAALRDEVDVLLRRLPSDQRIAVVLRDMYGYDVAEIAELQRCGLSAAKMRIARGRTQLKRLAIDAGLLPPEPNAPLG